MTDARHPLYDVELWRVGRYFCTLAGPYESPEAAERAAEFERRVCPHPVRPGDDVRVIPFTAKSDSSTHAQGRREA